MIVLAISVVVTVHSVDNEFSKCIHTLGPTVHTLTFTFKKFQRLVEYSKLAVINKLWVGLESGKSEIDLESQTIENNQMLAFKSLFEDIAKSRLLRFMEQKVLLIERLSK